VKNVFAKHKYRNKRELVAGSQQKDRIPFQTDNGWVHFFAKLVKRCSKTGAVGSFCEFLHRHISFSNVTQMSPNGDFDVTKTAFLMSPKCHQMSILMSPADGPW